MYQLIETKTILSKLRSSDSLFGISYSMNLYRGCQHGCIYCDTRSDCYQVGNIAEIRVKRNAINLLKNELASKITKGTIGTGSMNDPYMPLEAELEITRQALKVIAEKHFPVHIITKGELVTRDTDILQEIAKTYAAVSFTITTDDDQLANKIEPFAPSSSRRFAALEYLSKKGIYVGVTLMPLLPFVNDTKENIELLVRKAKDAGASYIIAMLGVTLRKGSRDYLYKAFDENFPGLKDKYKITFGGKYECYNSDYQTLYSDFSELCYKLDLPTKMNFYEAPTTNQLSLF